MALLLTHQKQNKNKLSIGPELIIDTDFYISITEKKTEDDRLGLFDWRITVRRPDDQ